ncbi:hypothetical protein ACFLTE_11855 [Bacteroidota bacterium]
MISFPIITGIFGIIIAIVTSIISRKEKPPLWATIFTLSLSIGIIICSYFEAVKQSNAEKDILYSITGGDSFCYIQFQNIKSGNGKLLVIHNGNYPIYDVEARIVDLDKYNQAASQNEKIKELLGLNYQIGNLIPGFARDLVQWKETIPGQLRLNIFFIARNGSYTQCYRRQLVDGEIAFANKVEYNGKIVLEEISKNFPKNEKGEIDWEE